MSGSILIVSRGTEIAGAVPDKRILNYCGGGIAATLDAYLLYQLGYTNLAVYDNSMNEWAKDDSLPIERLIVATNVNDILHRALTDGDYSAGETTPTITPSMDIQVSSNFERLLFDCGGRDGSALADQMRGFDEARSMQLTNSQREGAAKLFSSARADQDETARALQWAYRNADQVIDPHTGVGLHAALKAEGISPGTPVVTLATAHPAKFRDAVERAVGIRPALPPRVGDLFGREEHFVQLAGDYEATRDFVLETAIPSAS